MFITLPNDETITFDQFNRNSFYDDDGPRWVSCFYNENPDEEYLFKSWVVVMNGPNDCIVSQYFDQRYSSLKIDSSEPVGGDHNPFFWSDDENWQEVVFADLPLSVKMFVHETYQDMWWAATPAMKEVQA